MWLSHIYCALYCFIRYSRKVRLFAGSLSGLTGEGTAFALHGCSKEAQLLLHLLDDGVLVGLQALVAKV